MSDRAPSATERRLAQLEDELRTLRVRELIKDLRYTYWFSILDKNVDALLDCFTEDAELEYGFDIHLRGRPAIREFFEKMLGNPDLLRQIPSGSNHLIDVQGPDRASGRWMVEVGSLSNGEAPARRIMVQYFEQYRRIDRKWKLQHMKNDYLYFEKPPLETEMT